MHRILRLGPRSRYNSRRRGSRSDRGRNYRGGGVSRILFLLEDIVGCGLIKEAKSHLVVRLPGFLPPVKQDGAPGECVRPVSSPMVP